jgi:hypothetical protein
MKNLLFYTTHRQFKEIEYAAKFFNKSDYLKNNFEVIICCNNPNYEFKQLKDISKFEATTHIMLTTKNSGYDYGAIEAISDNFELFKNYKKVIHAHPDCYITDSSAIEEVMKQEFDVAAAELFHVNRTCFSIDFFIFSPVKNYFLNWKNAKTKVAEHWFYDIAVENKLNIVNLNRYEKNCGAHRNIDNLYLWHSHNLNEVENYLNK